MGKMLFDEQPLVVSRELARLIGLNEALVLQQVNYWLRINQQAGKNYFDGRYWTYNSITEWQQEYFPFWSSETVRRIFSKLVNMDLLITGNFNRERRDRTLWYSINEEQLERLSMEKKLEDSNKNNDEIEVKISNKCKTTNCGNALCQNDQMQDNKMTKCIMSNCGNALQQNDQMHYVKLTTPLPENTTKITDNKKISLSSPPTQKELAELIERYAAQMEANAFAVSEQRMIKSIMRIVAETLVAGQAIKAGGRVIQQKEIEVIVNQMGKKELQYVLDVLNSNTKPIKSIKNYILTIILNLPTNMPLFYQGGKLPPRTVKPPGTSFNNFASRDYTDIDLTGLMQEKGTGDDCYESSWKGG